MIERIAATGQLGDSAVSGQNKKDAALIKGQEKLSALSDGDTVRGKVIGIVGGGAIGRMVLQRLQGWDCSRFLYYDPYPMPRELEEKLARKRRKKGRSTRTSWKTY